MRLYVGLLWIALALSTKSEAAIPTTSAYETALRATLAATPSHHDSTRWDMQKWRGSLVDAYASRGFVPFWFSGGRLTGAAEGLLTELANVEEAHGLLARDYAIQVAVPRAQVGSAPSAAAIARADVALSLVAIRLASDLHVGRVRPADLGHDLDVRKPAFDASLVLGLLAGSTSVRATLDSFEPQLHHYALLKAALARYRALARSHADLTHLPALPRARVRPGEEYSGAPLLRQLLAALGDLSDAATIPEHSLRTLDQALVEGMKHFQARHGLEADGVLGPQTFQALTTSLSSRVQQIELSLERMRWLPPFETPPVIVNIPQFRLFAFRTTQDAARDILKMDVIVGETFKGRRTPVFAADMRYIVLQPYWDVPRSILRNELLPEIRANMGWIEKNSYQIVRGDGDDARVLPATAEGVRLLAQGAARLRQRPGPANALGRVKFMFPNRHNVYLHDTPARALFSRSRRAFSHGCIRVSDPMALLSHVMRDDPSWNEARLAEALSRGTPTRVPLIKPIRVFILYGTALANEDGRVQFFNDIYGQDAPLIARLAARQPRTAAAASR